MRMHFYNVSRERRARQPAAANQSYPISNSRLCRHSSSKASPTYVSSIWRQSRIAPIMTSRVVDREQNQQMHGSLDYAIFGGRVDEQPMPAYFNRGDECIALSFG